MPNATETADFLTPLDAARRTKLSRGAIYKAIAAGELMALRFGRAVRIPLESFNAWIDCKADSGAAR